MAALPSIRLFQRSRFQARVPQVPGQVPVDPLAVRLGDVGAAPGTVEHPDPTGGGLHVGRPDMALCVDFMVDELVRALAVRVLVGSTQAYALRSVAGFASPSFFSARGPDHAAVDVSVEWDGNAPVRAAIFALLSGLVLLCRTSGH